MNRINLLANVNPKGCNQYTGPGCSLSADSGGGSGGTEVKHHPYKIIQGVKSHKPTESQLKDYSDLIDIAGKDPHTVYTPGDKTYVVEWWGKGMDKSKVDAIRSFAKERGIKLTRGANGKVRAVLHPEPLEQRMKKAGESMSLDWRPNETIPEDYHANSVRLFVPHAPS